MLLQHAIIYDVLYTRGYVYVFITCFITKEGFIDIIFRYMNNYTTLSNV